MISNTWKDPIILGAIAGSAKFFFKDTYGKEYLNQNTINSFEPNDYEGKLIARHINNITHKECIYILDRLHETYDSPKKRMRSIFIRYKCFPDDMPAWLQNYLFSKGVLPESLSDEDVIWLESSND